jgi:hypothetical protein
VRNVQYDSLYGTKGSGTTEDTEFDLDDLSSMLRK